MGVVCVRAFVCACVRTRVCAERAQFNWIGNRSLSQPVVPLIYGKCIMQGGLRRQSNYHRCRPPRRAAPHCSDVQTLAHTGGFSPKLPVYQRPRRHTIANMPSPQRPATPPPSFVRPDNVSSPRLTITYIHYKYSEKIGVSTLVPKTGV